MVTKQMCTTAQVAVLMCSWFKLGLAMDELRYSEKQHKEMKARFENRMYKQLLLHFHDVLLNDCTGVLISPSPDQDGNKLQRQKILSFI